MGKLDSQVQESVSVKTLDARSRSAALEQRHKCGPGRPRWFLVRELFCVLRCASV